MYILTAEFDSLPFNGGATSTAAAIRLARTVLLNTSVSTQTKFRNFNVPVVVVLITDGRSTDRTAYVSELSQLDTRVDRHAFGVGARTDSSELLEFTQGVSSAVRQLASFADLSSFVDSVLTETVLCLECPLGSFRASACTRTADLVCQQTSAVCLSTEIEVSPPTTTSDRLCVPILPCRPGMTHYLNSTTCLLCTTCTSTAQFATQPCTASTDRTCAPTTACIVPQTDEALPPSPTSDRVCAAPCAASEFISIEATASTTRQCQSVSTCGSDAFELLPPTRVADRTCVPVSACPVHRFETIPATATTDRTCGRCNNCAAGLGDVLVMVDVSSSVCGGDGSNFAEVQDFLTRTIRSMPIGQTGIRVALLTFSTTATVHSTFLQSVSQDAVAALVSTITCTGGSTATDAAFRVARTAVLNPFLTTSTGFRAFSVPVQIIAVSNGGATVPLPLLDELALLDARIARYVVSIGSLSAAETAEVLSIVNQDATRVSAVTTFEDLNTVDANFFTDDICQPCLSSQYQESTCTTTTDVVCFPWQTCNASAFEAAGPTASSDRDCRACNPCAGGTQYTTTPCGATTDATCTPCAAPCRAFSFEATPCTPSSNRVCQACDFDCASGSFLVAPCSATRNRVCGPCTSQCPTGQFITRNCTRLADITCTTVSARCSPAVGTFEAAAPTIYTDRVCAAVTTCDSSTEFEAFPPTETTDRVCSAVTTTCPAGFSEAAPPSATTDRQCEFDGVCDLLPRVYDLVWLLDASGSISESDFERMKSFVLNVLSGEDISASRVQVATVLFHDQAEEVFELSRGRTFADVERLIQGIAYSTENRGTALGDALRYVDENILLPSRGHRVDEPIRMVVITDGRAGDTARVLQQRIAALTLRDISIATVGIGSVDRSQLLSLASVPELVFAVDTFEGLDSSTFFTLFESRFFGCVSGIIIQALNNCHCCCLAGVYRIFSVVRRKLTF